MVRFSDSTQYHVTDGASDLDLTSEILLLFFLILAPMWAWNHSNEHKCEMKKLGTGNPLLWL